MLILGIIIFGTPFGVEQVFAGETQSLESTFYRANDYYEKYDYQNALEGYQALLDAGYASGPVYYNLANTYYRLGEKGMALVNYLRARAYIPRDPDLRSNLEYLEKELQLFDSEQGSGLERIADWVGNYLTVQELVIWSSVILTVLVGLIFGQMYLPKMRSRLKVSVVVVGGLLVVSLLLTGVGGYYLYYTNPGIIVNEEAIARFEPSDSGEAHFTLALGDRVEIRSQRHEWVSVERADGKKGWVKVGEVEGLGYDGVMARGEY